MSKVSQQALAVPVPADSPDYRPHSYFGGGDAQSYVMTRVKGALRRRALTKMIAAGVTPDLSDPLAQSALSSEDRAVLGSFHPRAMGGEYLPNLRGSEVEIARIVIDSTTSDVTVVHARRCRHRIHYRVADEYQGDTLHKPSRRTSNRPLTMDALLDFFLGSWNLYAGLEANFSDGDIEGMLGFFQAESEFYPCLDEALRRRVRARFAAPGADALKSDEKERL
jgi:hypothetical protein